MEFIAVDQNGNSVRRTTSTRRGTQNPDWYQRLNFGNRSWRYLKVKVYDEDSGSDDALSDQQTIRLPYAPPQSYNSHSTHHCHSGYAVFDIHLTTLWGIQGGILGGYIVSAKGIISPREHTH